MNKIKEYRKSNGITQIELAKKLNVKQSTIANWETEYRNPSIKQAIEIAKILKTTVENLYK